MLSIKKNSHTTYALKCLIITRFHFIAFTNQVHSNSNLKALTVCVKFRLTKIDYLCIIKIINRGEIRTQCIGCCLPVFKISSFTTISFILSILYSKELSISFFQYYHTLSLDCWFRLSKHKQISVAKLSVNKIIILLY